jgi:hypothetical protein
MLQRLLEMVSVFEHLLLEDKVEFIVTKQGKQLWDAFEHDKGAGKPKLKTADEIVKFLANEISEKHLQKLANWYQKNDFSLEDASKIKDSINRFEKLRKKLDKKDLNQYKTSVELDTALAPFNEDDEKSNKQLNREYVAKLFKEKQAKLVHEGGGVRVIIPNTEEASKYLGRGTRWCTAADDNNMFSTYSKRGAPLYVIVCDDGEKYQFHFKTGQYMDAKDHPIKVVDLVKKYPVLYDVFADEAEKWGVIELIKPASLTDEKITTIFEKVCKANAKYPSDVFTWLRNKVIYDRPFDSKMKDAFVKFVHDAVKTTRMFSMFTNEIGIFLKLDPAELVDLAKLSEDAYHGSPILTMMSEKHYVEHIFSDKAAFQKLVDIIVGLVKDGSRIRVSDYLTLLTMPKAVLGSKYKLEDWVTTEFLDEVSIKHGADAAKILGYEPAEAIQLKMVEKDPGNINDMPYASNRVKERARMFAKAASDRGRYGGR